MGPVPLLKVNGAANVDFCGAVVVKGGFVYTALETVFVHGAGVFIPTITFVVVVGGDGDRVLEDFPIV